MQRVIDPIINRDFLLLVFNIGSTQVRLSEEVTLCLSGARSCYAFKAATHLRILGRNLNNPRSNCQFCSTAAIGPLSFCLGKCKYQMTGFIHRCMDALIIMSRIRLIP